MQVNTVFLHGGIQRHVLDLTHELRAFGHEVSVAGGDGGWGIDTSDPLFFPVPLDRVAAGNGGKLARMAAILPAVMQLRKAVRQSGAQLVHAHETAPALIAKMATIGMNIPIVFTYHGSTVERQGQVAMFARCCADMTVSPSHTSIDALISKGLPRDRTRVLGLGVHPHPETDQNDVDALRTSLIGDDKDAVLILSVSRLAHQKGIDLMVQVAKQVTDQRDNVIFAVAGGGPQTELAPEWAREAGVSDKIKFLGPVSTIPLHLAAADIFLLTSRWEALPISIVEAFRSKLPVVATNCGGVRELVDDKVGALLEVGDIEGTSKALIELIDNADLRRQKGQAAFDLSQESRFDPTAVHRQFEALYQEILS